MPPTPTTPRHAESVGRRRSRALGIAGGIAGLALAACLGGCNTGITDADIENVSLTELRLLWLEQQEDPRQPLLMLVDPRRREAFEGARLPGALHLTLPDLAQRTGGDPGMTRFEHIVVYAQGPGDLAGRAMTKRLLVLGYDQTRLFGGGVVEWADAGFPIAQGEPENEVAKPAPRDVRRPVP